MADFRCALMNLDIFYILEFWYFGLCYLYHYGVLR